MHLTVPHVLHAMQKFYASDGMYVIPTSELWAKVIRMTTPYQSFQERLSVLSVKELTTMHEQMLGRMPPKGKHDIIVSIQKCLRTNLKRLEEQRHALSCELNKLHALLD